MSHLHKAKSGDPLFFLNIFFGLSLLGVIIQMYHNLFVIKSIAVYGPGAMFMTILILIVALFLYWYSKFVQKKNWVS